MKPFISYLEGVLLAGLGLGIICSQWLAVLPVLIAGFVGLCLWAEMTSDYHDYCGY